MLINIFTQPDTWIALLTLTFLEIVLGIDNIIFISLVTGKLPKETQPKARIIGLSLALIFRIGLLLGISYIIHFTEPIISFKNFQLSGRDIILLGGGLFLLAKSTSEIHEKINDQSLNKEEKEKKVPPKFWATIFQIILLDIVFSFDSILTAVGLTEHVIVMIIAVVLAMIVMLLFAQIISDFIHKHPTFQILALSFLILIGTMLIAEAFHYHVPKGYIYFAVAYSLVVELINMRVRKNRAE
jgi:predicted tellurium resistance membrane protein TerC